MGLLTIEQAADHCQIGRTFAWRLAKTAWPVVRLGRLVRIDEAALDRWLQEEAQGGAATGATMGPSPQLRPPVHPPRSRRA